MATIEHRTDVDETSTASAPRSWHPSLFMASKSVHGIRTPFMAFKSVHGIQVRSWLLEWLNTDSAGVVRWRQFFRIY
jgi:hypothetical protein